MSNESDYPAKYQLEDGSGFYLMETGTDYLIKETQNYAELVVSDGAICYFRFNETSGNFTDLVGGRIGTANGSISYSQVGALVGDPDTSIRLSSADAQFVAINGAADLTPAGHSNNLTIEMWANAENNAATDGVQLWDWTGVGPWTMAVQLFDDTTQEIDFSAAASGGTTLFSFAAAVFAARSGFHHYVGIIDAGTSQGRLYLDGAEAATPVAWSGTPITWTNQSLRLGLSSGGVIPLKGRMDEFAIYPTALTAAQIARHYRCGIQFLPDIPPPVMLGAH